MTKAEFDDCLAAAYDDYWPMVDNVDHDAIRDQKLWLLFCLLSLLMGTGEFTD